MSVKKDSSGRRTVELEIEVPGTPEQVWQAIATGPGISAWFTPTDVEEREGGSMTFHMGPDFGDSPARVTRWEPPARFAYEEVDWAPNAPPLATELTVHARAGGRCIVRLVHSLFAAGDDWDDQLESFEAGWPGFFEILRHYLDRYAGQPSAVLHVRAMTTMTEADAWRTIVRELGLDGAGEGQSSAGSRRGVPPFKGVVQKIGGSVSDQTPAGGPAKKRTPYVVVQLDEPAPGAGLVGVYAWADQQMVSVALYFYGDRARELAARHEAGWRDWVAGVFSGEGAAVRD